MALFNYSEEDTISDWRGNVVTVNHSNSTVRWPTAAMSVTYARSKMIALAAALTVLIIFTVLGNLLVCVALFRYQALRTISNCLIGNLAASDFLLAVTVLPFSATNQCLGQAQTPLASICCGFVVQQAVEQIHNKSKYSGVWALLDDLLFHSFAAVETTSTL